MNEQQNALNPPTIDTQQTAKIQRSNTLKLRWAVVCLIGPTALIVLSVVAYALINLVTASSTPQAAGDELVASPPVGVTISNIILFLAGAIAVATWLPGIIAGIVLLALRQRT